jgi:hypothetical protein
MVLARRPALLLCAALALSAAAGGAEAKVTKKLIEFGWDEPDPAFMRRHAAQMERTPFDGCVFHLDYTRPDRTEGRFTWECWGRRAFTLAELKPGRDDLKATRFRRFRHNFLRFNVTPADLDWFDDYSAVLNNARLAARIAREGRCKGIALDVEPYQQPLFNYRKQRDAGMKNWDEYAVQARRRGQEVMRAFQSGYPGLTVFLTVGYGAVWDQSGGGRRPLAGTDFGLLAPFLDGMVDATVSPARLIDGYEQAYSYRDTTLFDKGYRAVKHDLLRIVSPRQKYASVFTCAFGIWLDYDWRGKGWNTKDLSRNYYNPAAFETSVRKALRASDEYVWIYSETPRWWTEDGGPLKLPPEYDAALRRVRREFGRD